MFGYIFICILIILFAKFNYVLISTFKICFNLSPEFYSIDQFPKFNKLMKNYLKIKKEANNLLENSIYTQHRNKDYIYGTKEMQEYINDIKFKEQWLLSWNIANNKPNYNWLNYPLMYDNTALSKINPITTQLLKDINGIRMAGFSWMLPNSNIGEHRDDCGLLTKSLALHIGLDVPDKKCFLLVNSKKIFEKNGKVIIFDSNYLHSAYNRSNKNRLILYIDFVNNLN